MLPLRDEVLDIAVTPDRGYCLSLRGVAREAAPASGRAFPDPADRAGAGLVRGGYPVRRRGPGGCPVFVARLGDRCRPDRARLRAGWRAGCQLAGMRPISLAVDVTNYVMLELGQPIHALRPRPAGRPDRRPPGACRASS